MATPSRDPERLLRAIRRMHELCPDLRVGQMIANVLALSGRGSDPFYIENDRLAELLEREIAKGPGAWRTDL